MELSDTGPHPCTRPRPFQMIFANAKFHPTQPFPAANQTTCSAPLARSLSLFPLLGRFLDRSYVVVSIGYTLTHRVARRRTRTDGRTGRDLFGSVSATEERARGREGAIVRKLVFRSAHAMPTTAAMAEVLRERLSGNDISPLAALAHAGTRMTCTATSVVAKVTIQGPQDSKAAFITSEPEVARWKAR